MPEGTEPIRSSPNDPLRDGPPIRAWRELSRRIRGCHLCPLGEFRRHAVVYRGGREPWVVFIGEAPGREEDESGIPFVGRSGKILDRVLVQIHLGPEEYGILNSVKCRPRENRLDPGAARACRPYLIAQLALLKPRVIVTLGRHALHALDPTAPGIFQIAGAARSWGLIPLFPMIHPAASLRSRAGSERWGSDARALAAWIGSQRRQPL